MRLVAQWLDGPNKGSDRYVLILWVFLAAHLLLTCISELGNIKKMGFITYVSNDFWNVFELVQMALLAQLLNSLKEFYFLSSEIVDDLDTLLATEKKIR